MQICSHHTETALAAIPQRFDSSLFNPVYYHAFYCTKRSRWSILPYFEYSIEKSGHSEIWDKGKQVVGRKYCPAQCVLSSVRWPVLSSTFHLLLAVLGVAL